MQPSGLGRRWTPSSGNTSTPKVSRRSSTRALRPGWRRPGQRRGEQVSWLSVLKESGNRSPARCRTREGSGRKASAPGTYGRGLPRVRQTACAEERPFRRLHRMQRVPECKFTKPVLVKTGAVCPKCGEGMSSSARAARGNPSTAVRATRRATSPRESPLREKCRSAARIFSQGDQGAEECVKCGFSRVREPASDE